MILQEGANLYTMTGWPCFPAEHIRVLWVILDAMMLQLVLEVASGKQTKNEENGYREISIFKDGVTL